jgi:hypothetical protein
MTALPSRMTKIARCKDVLDFIKMYNPSMNYSLKRYSKYLCSNGDSDEKITVMIQYFYSKRITLTHHLPNEKENTKQDNSMSKH